MGNIYPSAHACVYTGQRLFHVQICYHFSALSPSLKHLCPTHQSHHGRHVSQHLTVYYFVLYRPVTRCTLPTTIVGIPESSVLFFSVYRIDISLNKKKYMTLSSKTQEKDSYISRLILCVEEFSLL